MSTAAHPQGGDEGRVAAAQHWLAKRTDNRVGRFSLLWFRRYFEASRNSACAATLYMFLSVAPAGLALVGIADAAGKDTNAVANRLVDKLSLSGATADLVHATFGSAASNALAASLAAVVGFLVWGIGIAQIYQDFYCRIWGIPARTLSGQGRFAVWFFAFTGASCLAFLASDWLRAAGWVAFIPAWLIGATVFWTWTPRYLLHRRVSVRSLLPGSLLTGVVVGGAIGCSPLFLGGWLKTDGQYFGSFGIVVALLSWAFVLTTLTTVCAVFAHVWDELAST
jgi:membrane protein